MDAANIQQALNGMALGGEHQESPNANRGEHQSPRASQPSQPPLPSGSLPHSSIPPPPPSPTNDINTIPPSDEALQIEAYITDFLKTYDSFPAFGPSDPLSTRKAQAHRLDLGIARVQKHMATTDNPRDVHYLSASLARLTVRRRRLCLPEGTAAASKSSIAPTSAAPSNFISTLSTQDSQASSVNTDALIPLVINPHASAASIPLFLHYISAEKVNRATKHIRVLEDQRSSIPDYVASIVSPSADILDMVDTAFEDWKIHGTGTTTPEGQRLCYLYTLWENYPVGICSPQTVHLLEMASSLFITDDQPRCLAMFLAKLVEFGCSNRDDQEWRDIMRRYRFQLASLLVAAKQHVAFLAGTAYPRMPHTTPPLVPQPPRPALPPSRIPTRTAPPTLPRSHPTVVTSQPPTHLTRPPMHRGLGYHTPSFPTTPDHHAQNAPINFVPSTNPVPPPPPFAHPSSHTIDLTGTPPPQTFDPIKRGKYDFHPDAPEQWPAFAIHFQYQQPYTPIQAMTNLYHSPPDKQYKNVMFHPEEKLSLGRDYQEWRDTVWQPKTFTHFHVNTRQDIQNVILWGALDLTIQQSLRLKITKSLSEEAIPEDQFLYLLFNKVGASEWLDFNLRKLCSRHRDSSSQKAEHIIFNATVNTDGSNAKFVLNKFIWAAEQSAAEPFGTNLRMSCCQLIRAFKHCSIDNINTAIRTRRVVKGLSTSGTTFIDHDFIDERKDQGDRDPLTGHINWTARWKILKEHAIALVDKLATHVHQLAHVSEDHYPVYIPGWTPVNLSGFSAGGHEGPTPPPSISPARKPPRSPRTYPRRDVYDKYRCDPPSFDQCLKWWESHTDRCLACGSKKYHTSYKDCPVRQQFFPDWTPDMRSLISSSRRVTESQRAFLAATQANPPSPRYNEDRLRHNDRPRTYVRERDRDLSRGRSRSRDSRGRPSRSTSSYSRDVNYRPRDNSRDSRRSSQPHPSPRKDIGTPLPPPPGAPPTN